MRLFRQHKLADWPQVISRIANALHEKLTAAHPEPSPLQRNRLHNTTNPNHIPRPRRLTPPNRRPTHPSMDQPRNDSNATLQEKSKFSIHGLTFEMCPTANRTIVATCLLTPTQSYWQTPGRP